MSDLGLAVDYSSVLEAIKATTNLEDSWARMVQGVIAEERRLAAMAKASDQQVEEGFARMTKKVEDQAQKHYDALVTKRMRFQNRMDAQRNKEEVSAFASMRREAEEENRNIDRIAAEKQRAIDDEIAANEKAKASYLQMAGRYDPVIRNTNELVKATQTLDEAFERGIITIAQYNARLEQVKSATVGGAGDFNQFGAKALMSGKNLGYFGMVTQQAGYQLQDFFVQIQSGTRPLVALGQQGSQMAGIFGPGGAVVGALLAVGTALAGVALASVDLGKDSEALAEDFKTAAETMEESAKRLGAVFVNDLARSVGVGNQALQDFLNTWNDIDNKSFEKSSELVKEDLLKEVRKAQASINAVDTGNVVFGIEDASLGMDSTESTKELLRIVQNLGGATREEWLRSVIDVNTALAQSGQLSQKELETAQAKVKAIAESLGLQEEMDRLAEEGASSREKELSFIVQSNDMVRQFRAERKAAVEEDAKNGLDFFKTTTEAAIKQAEDFIPEFEKLVTESISEAERQAEAHQEAVDAAQVALNALIATTFPEDWLDTAIRKANELAGAFRSAIQAKLEADSAGGLEFFRTTTEAAIARGEADKESGLDFFVSTTEAAIAESETIDQGDDGSGVGKGGGKAKVDRLAKLEQEYQQKLKIAKLSGEQLEYEQTYQAVVKALGEDQSKYSEDFINQKTAELAEVQKLIDLENDRKDLLKSVEGAFEDMFMSMADGTKSVKDAFTDMARSIVAELWKVLVVKQAVNAVSGFIGGIGSGGGFNLGGTPSNSVVSVNDAVISPSGQIISTSPEDFLIATKKPQNLANTLGGSGNSNTVSDGGVTVNQTFQITGSDQATVQQALARAMPAIVTATKSAIVDSRRRGSSDLRGSF